jgi:hypothetical protein
LPLDHLETELQLYRLNPDNSENRERKDLMRKLYIVCLITLAAVFIDVAFFHSRTVSAQNSQIEVRKVEMGDQNKQVAVIGNVVGFNCVYNNGGNPLCFIATSR